MMMRGLPPLLMMDKMSIQSSSPRKYISDMSYGVSDHKPVIGTFSLEISVDKGEIPLLSGQYVWGYYSTNMQSIVGLSANFQILESKRAVMEGLVPDNVNGLHK
ncbi:hypothetical protein INR49_027791 [Caranx melampygus]|nr:hypothetical protein INR49_027791 [Caranx melampygus]